MAIQNRQSYVPIIRPRCYMRLKQSNRNNNLRLGVSKLCHNNKCTNHNKRNMAI